MHFASTTIPVLLFYEQVYVSNLDMRYTTLFFKESRWIAGSSIRLPNSVTYTHQQEPTNICSHITTSRYILIGYFNNCNFSKHE